VIHGAPWKLLSAYRSAYFANMSPISVLATGHTSTAGFWWLLNPVSPNTVRLFVRRVDFVSQIGSVLATPTSPRITLERMTFTGTPSGTTVTPASALSGAPAATGTVRTTSGGITPAAGAAFHCFLPVAAMTAVGAASAEAFEYYPDAPIELAPGEGIVARQADNGTSGDTRRVSMTVQRAT
jgi:hypothetical protein